MKVNATDFETKSGNSGKDFTISISEPMTKEETARKFSKENGVSYKKAFVTLYIAIQVNGKNTGVLNQFIMLP